MSNKEENFILFPKYIYVIVKNNQIVDVIFEDIIDYCNY